MKVSPSTQRRALGRLLEVASASSDRSAEQRFDALFRWLGGRADRHLYRVAAQDLSGLRSDSRIVPSGVSDPRSGMQDVRVVEGYVAGIDLDGVVGDYWLDPPGVDAPANVYLHVSPGQPGTISTLMLAADLFERQGPREHARAVQLAEDVFS